MDLKLNREIAEILGWKIVTVEKYYHTTYHLFRPDGKQIGNGRFMYDMTERSMLNQIPNYSGDLAVAWNLQREHPIEQVPWLMNMEWLKLPPVEVAEQMARSWLRWTMVKNDSTT